MSIKDTEWLKNGIRLQNDPDSQTKSRKDVLGSYEFSTQDLSKDPETLAYKKITDFLDVLAPSSKQGYESTFIQFQDLKVKCTNQDAIKKAGMTPPTRFEMRFTTNFFYRPQDLDSLWNKIEKLQKLSACNFIMQVAHFYREGRTNEDEYLKFMLLWIAFNALYRQICRQRQRGGTED